MRTSIIPIVVLRPLPVVLAGFIRRRIAGILLFLACSPMVALAQTAPGQTEANNVLGWMTGTVATALAAICVSGLGFLSWAGRLSLKWGMSIIAGIVLVFGSVNLVAWLQTAAT